MELKYEKKPILIKSGYMTKIIDAKNYSLLDIIPNIEKQGYILSDNDWKYKEKFHEYSKEKFNNTVTYYKIYINNINKEKIVSILSFCLVGTKCKIWLNGKYVSYNDSFSSHIIFEIDVGLNTLLIELYNKDLTYRIIFYLEQYELNDLCGYKEATDWLYFASANETEKSLMFRVENRNALRNNNKYICKILLERFNSNMETVEKEEYEVFSLDINQIIEYDFSNIFNMFPEIYSFLIEIREYNLLDNEEIGYTVKRIFKNSINELFEQFESLILNLCKNNIYKEYILKKLENIKNIKYMPGKYYFLVKMINDLKYFLEFENHNNYLIAPGYKEIMVKSKLDDNLYSFYCNVPVEYDVNKKYPIIMILTYNSSPTHILKFAEEFKKECIVIECPTRGYTFGNYIAEATVIEVMRKINDLYNVDEERVILIGYSSSAATALNLISKHPKKFSCCYAIAGMFNSEIMRNCFNNRIEFLLGTEDVMFYDFYKKSENILDTSNFKFSYKTDLEHGLIYPYIYNFKLIKELIGYKRLSEKNYEKYYLTDFNYGQFQSFIIIDFVNNNEVACVEFHNDGHTISLRLKNINRILLKKDIEYDISSEVIKNFKILTYKDQIYNTRENKLIDIREGFFIKKGISSIYLQGINIWIKNESEKEYVNFISEPRVMSIDSKILIKYPIGKINYYDELPEKSKNHVFLNFDLSKYDVIEKIEFDESGFYINQNSFTGDYIVMQLLPNIWNKDYYCLFINTNNFDLMQKCVFTRYLNLSSNASENKKDIFSLQNLIYYNNKYYTYDERINELKGIYD